MARTTNEQILDEVRRLERNIERHAQEEKIARLELRDEMENSLEEKLRSYVLEVVFKARLKPLEQYAAGIIGMLASIAGGLIIWLITR